MGGVLTPLFLPHVGPAAREAIESTPDLEEILAETLEQARRAWPAIRLAPALFLRHLAERLPETDARQALETVSAGDLYLACACARGDSLALAALEKSFLSQMSAYLSGSNALPAFADEVRQALRERLLVAKDGLLPKIAGYTGRGPLGAWLRMSATRVAVDIRRSQKPATPIDDTGAVQLRAPGPDPELEYMKTRYGRELGAAFQATLEALDARSANVLRLYFLESLPTDAIGALYRVHARTVRKWIEKCRRDILAETRRQLASRLGLEQRELESLMGLVQSRLDPNISEFLRGNKKVPT